MNARRKTDKVELIYKIAIGGLLTLILYIATLMRDEIRDVKTTQKEIIGYYIEMKDELNRIKVEYPRAIAETAEKTMEKVDEKFDRFMDRIYALFEKNEKDKS